MNRDGRDDEIVCVICLETLGATQETAACIANAVSHVFHAECLTKWTAVRPTCPTCAEPLDDFINVSSTARNAVINGMNKRAKREYAEYERSKRAFRTLWIYWMDQAAYLEEIASGSSEHKFVLQQADLSRMHHKRAERSQRELVERVERERIRAS